MVSDIDENDNLIIKGNNLIALHSIKIALKNKLSLFILMYLITLRRIQVMHFNIIQILSFPLGWYF